MNIYSCEGLRRSQWHIPMQCRLWYTLSWQHVNAVFAARVVCGLTRVIAVDARAPSIIEQIAMINHRKLF